MIKEHPTRRGQLKGYLFEAIIRTLLERVGWRVANQEENGRVRITSRFNIEIKGRGTWHQIDTPCILIHRIPFIYPLRLLVETKFYSREVQKEAIRSFIGIIKDISENYFIDDIHGVDSQKRYTDLGTFFSATGFQEEAVNLAFAHGIKTISYRSNPLMDRIKKSIELIEGNGLTWAETIGVHGQYVFMQDLDELFKSFHQKIEFFLSKYHGNGHAKLELEKLNNYLSELNANFFGMTSAGVLLHFLSKESFPNELFQSTDEQFCRIYYENINSRNIPMWLEFSADLKKRRFFFDVPPGLEKEIQRGWDVIGEKERQFDRISVSYFIDGLFRSLILKIDKDWLERLKNRKIG